MNDLIEEIGVSVSANGSEHAVGIDIRAVAEEIRDTYGLISIDTTTEDGEHVIPFETYWALVTKHDATQWTTVTLFETNGDVVAIQPGEEVIWVFDPARLTTTFGQDAQALIEGDWELSVDNGQTPTTAEGLTAVATYGPEGLKLLVAADVLRAAARIYLGLSDRSTES